MKRSILLILVLLNSLTVLFSQEKNMLVEDNFSNNYYKWWVGRSAVAISSISHGEYILAYRGQKSWSSNIIIDLNQNDDVVIESKISRMSGTSENGYGLTWGKGKNGYYNFIITPKGKFYVRKVETGRRGKYLVNWKKIQHEADNNLADNKLSHHTYIFK